MIGLSCLAFANGTSTEQRGNGGCSADEHQVKAAFLYNFAKYVKWPDRVFSGANAPIVFGIVGDDPFGKVLDETLRDKSVGARKLEVRRFKSVTDVDGCQLLFVASSEAPRLPKIVEQCQGKSVLIVGEADQFAAHGGCIGFFLDSNKVRFEINVDAAKRAELEISSQILKLARIVKEDTGAH